MNQILPLASYFKGQLGLRLALWIYIPFWIFTKLLKYTLEESVPSFMPGVIDFSDLSDSAVRFLAFTFALSILKLIMMFGLFRCSRNFNPVPKWIARLYVAGNAAVIMYVLGNMLFAMIRFS